MAEPDLVKLFESGQLGADTLVWTEELEQWTRARDVDGLVPSAHNPPPLPTSQPAVSAAVVAEYTPSGKQVRPWVRFWARLVDNFLFGLLAGMVLAVVYQPALQIPDGVLAVITVFAYVFVEAEMLAAWGTTPGKGLLRVRLRNRDGTKLSYGNALRRALKVWFRGEGLGIPFVGLFTLSHAYNRLRKKGMTSWDEEGNCVISHQVVGAWRAIVTALILMAALLLMALPKLGM